MVKFWPALQAHRNPMGLLQASNNGSPEKCFTMQLKVAAVWLEKQDVLKTPEPVIIYARLEDR